MDTQRLVTRSQIAADLLQLGLREGDVLMCHESVKSIGWIQNGPDQILHAIFDVIGVNGTLMKYIGSDDAWVEEHGYDAATTPAIGDWGILCERLRLWPEACRSRHPDGSFAAVGPLASWLTGDHPLQYGFGPDSPTARLVEASGRVLLMGCPLEHTTLIHHAEHEADIPKKTVVTFQKNVLRRGRKVSVVIEEFDTTNGIAPWSGPEDYFVTIMKAFFAAGYGRQGKVGHAESSLIEAAELHAFARRWLERTFA